MAMTYFQAVTYVLTQNWFGKWERDSVSGNGFQIAGYGLILIWHYIIFFIGRTLIAVLFPLSAVLMIWVEKRNIERLNRWAKEADKDL